MVAVLSIVEVIAELAGSMVAHVEVAETDAVAVGGRCSGRCLFVAIAIIVVIFVVIIILWWEVKFDTISSHERST